MVIIAFGTVVFILDKILVLLSALSPETVEYTDHTPAEG